jgi:hypothetical protein
MKSLKSARLCAVALLVSHALWVTTVYSADSAAPATPAFKEEFSKQKAIYDSRGAQTPEGYVTDRSLLSYTFTLPPEFNQSLATLGPQDRWLDIGAGEGRAILDYCTSKYDVMHPQTAGQQGKKAKAVAISIEDRRTVHWEKTAASLEPQQIKYLFTDVMGGFSYTQNLALFMEKALGLLETDGSLYTVLQDVSSEEGANRPFYPGSPFLTELQKADGSKMSVCAWLKSIGGVEVTCEFKPNWEPPVEVYRIHKVSENVTVPALTPVHFQAGTPPERRFQLSKPLPSSRDRESAAR